MGVNVCSPYPLLIRFGKWASATPERFHPFLLCVGIDGKYSNVKWLKTFCRMMTQERDGRSRRDSKAKVASGAMRKHPGAAQFGTMRFTPTEAAA